MKRISVFGATGSVGGSTLDIVRQHADSFTVEVLTAGRSWEKLARLARAFRPKLAVLADDSGLAPLADALAGTGIAVAAGRTALIEAASRSVDLVVAGIVGAAGLAPTLAALEAGVPVALANKEALVCAGHLMLEAAAKSGARILPIDSEHNAIFQVLERRSAARPDDVRRIILTASGGPFRTWTRAAMQRVAPAEAVRHPVWAMGAKISVDSATMMNKGLELIEARHLFGLTGDRLDILVHPQSLVHGLVEYVDGALIAGLAVADMRIPIAYALGWPDRIATPAARLALSDIGRLDFEPPDRTRFPAIALAEQVLAAGGCRPPVLNAANEEAVRAFLQSRIGFLDIVGVVEGTLAEVPERALATLADVRAVDKEARVAACRIIDAFAARRRAG